jgi:hypothetical protein
MAPFMLMAPGSTYIQLKLDSNGEAMQVSMDPCRRVLGTTRDYVPFGGSIGGVFGQYNYINPWCGTGGFTSAANACKFTMTGVSYLPGGIACVAPAGVPIDVNASAGPIKTAIFNSIAQTSPTVSQDVMQVIARFSYGSFSSCIGGNLAPLQTWLNSTVSKYTSQTANSSINVTGSANYSLMFCPFSVAGMEGNWTTFELESADTLTYNSYIGTFNNCELPRLGNTNSGVYTTTTGNSQANYYSMYGWDSALGSAIGNTAPGFGTVISPLANYENTTAGLTTYTTSTISNAASVAIPMTAGTVTGDTFPISKYPVGNPTTGNIVSITTCTPVGSNQQAGLVAATGGIQFWLNQKQTFSAHPAGIPLPQYMLVTTPWALKTLVSVYVSSTTDCSYKIYGDAITPNLLCSESYACYGTYLENSRHQSMRCFSGGTGTNGIGNSATGNSGNTYGLATFSLSNVEFVGYQVILPDTVTASILSSANTGDISVHANTVRVYQSPIQSSNTTQNILIPAKIASANSMFTIFKPGNYTSGSYDVQLYESTSRYCPFSSIFLNGAATTSQTGGQNSVGQQYQFTTINPPCSSGQTGAFEIQLKIGNDLYPQQPITCLPEVIAENEKAMHKLFDVTSNMNISFALTTSSGFNNTTSSTISSVYNLISDYGSTDSSNGLWYDCLADNTFTAAFSFAPYLDDQTYIANPNWGYIAMCASQYTNMANNTSGQPATSSSTLPSYLYGTRYPYVLPLFTPLTSTFFLGFDMDTWSRQSGVARSGKYLGNNQITLYMNNCNGFNSYNTGLTSINLLTVVICDIRFSFQSGGSVIAYY